MTISNSSVCGATGTVLRDAASSFQFLSDRLASVPNDNLASALTRNNISLPSAQASVGECVPVASAGMGKSSGNYLG